MTIYEQLRKRWADAANDGAASAALASFEKVNGLLLPTAFKEYLTTVNGMRPGLTDEDLVSFLTLDGIGSETKEQSRPGDIIDFVFAEYSVFSHYYALRARRTGEDLGVFAADGTNQRQIATRFEEFVQRYLTSPARIAHCFA